MRVVRAVRAGEAKLPGRTSIVVFIAGPPGGEYGGVCALPFASFLLLFEGVFNVFCFFLGPNLFFILFTKALRTCRFFVRQYNAW